MPLPKPLLNRAEEERIKMLALRQAQDNSHFYFCREKNDQDQDDNYSEFSEKR